MSLIPKVTIGRKTDRHKFNIPALTHGTSEIGYVYPSYSRNLINNSHFSISSRQAIRLSPLFVPTMGDLSLRTYHCFVPHNKLWTPFDAFLDKKPFAFPDGTSRVPENIPHFIVGTLLRELMAKPMADTFFDYKDLDSLRNGLVMSIYRDRSDEGKAPTLCSLEYLNEHFIPTQRNVTIGDKTLTINSFDKLDQYFCDGTLSDGYSGYQNLRYSGVPSLLYAPDSDTSPAHVMTGGDLRSFILKYDGSMNEHFPMVSPTHYQLIGTNHDRFSEVSNYLTGLSVPSYDACDFMCTYEDYTEAGEGNPDQAYVRYYMCYNFNGAWKRLRSVFLGLGYCFNPFDTESVTPLKLLAFYRSYWHLFGVNRNINFQDTNCAKFTRLISLLYRGLFKFSDNQVYMNFIQDLTHLTYTTPADYFSSAVDDTQQGILDMGNDGITITSQIGDLGSNQTLGAKANPRDDTEPGGVTPLYGDNPLPALAIQMALKMLRFVNRYTVVGSRIYDSLAARYGNISINDESTEGVRKIGEDSTPINIGAIFNQSDTENGAPLGDFAGVGTGNGKSERFSFDVDSFGVFVSLTVVVPQMGYYQGMFRENSDGCLDNFEMFDPTYDACGWQLVRKNELVADRQFEGHGIVGTRTLGNFGFTPRYTHMKVGFNRCIGDISLPHMQYSMLPYTLDRFFPQREAVPVNNPQWFRSGTRGETNRIFQVTSPTDDHVIWQIYYDVEYDAPMKSISESYDTRLPDDNSSVQVSHE